MLETTNYKFKKPELADSPPDITVMNPNWDSIDAKLKTLETHNAENVTAHNDIRKQINDLDADVVAHKAEKATNDEYGHIRLIDIPKPETIPAGLISMWSGSLELIPDGWVLCDGENGTPDLRNRFIVGAGDEYSIGDVGGEKEVTLTEQQMPAHGHAKGTLSTGSTGSHSHSGSTSTDGSHSHSYADGSIGIGGSSSMGSGGSLKTTDINRTSGTGGSHSHSISTNSTGSHSHTISGTTADSGGGQAHENRPPYFALAYIMKL